MTFTARPWAKQPRFTFICMGVRCSRFRSSHRVATESHRPDRAGAVADRTSRLLERSCYDVKEQSPGWQSRGGNRAGVATFRHHVPTEFAMRQAEQSCQLVRV